MERSRRRNMAHHGQHILLHAQPELWKHDVHAGQSDRRHVGPCGGEGRADGASVGELEGVEWEELWDAAERYRVPILLRETWPVGSEVCCSLYLGNQTREKGNKM